MVRRVAQTISYEVSIALIFLGLVYLSGSFLLGGLRLVQYYILAMFIFFITFVCWLVSRLAETNRTPFDFAEGESELVSGFNVEYGRGGFTLLFLSEYGRIIFIRVFMGIIYLGGLIGPSLNLCLWGGLFMMVFI